MRLRFSRKDSVSTHDHSKEGGFCGSVSILIIRTPVKRCNSAAGGHRLLLLNDDDLIAALQGSAPSFGIQQTLVFQPSRKPGSKQELIAGKGPDV